jgi:hypothetical protein
MPLLEIMVDLVQHGLGNMLAVTDVSPDGGMSVTWNLDSKLGQIGALLDEACECDGKADDLDESPTLSTLYAADVERLRAAAKRARADARALCDGLSEDEKVAVSYIGGPKLKGFVLVGIDP